MKSEKFGCLLTVLGAFSSRNPSAPQVSGTVCNGSRQAWLRIVPALPEFIVIVALLLLPVRAGASPRLWQPLIIKGSSLPALLGRKTEHFEILAMHHGILAPIPFQIDEVLPDGSFALPDGPEPVADNSPGILHRSDEIVMMISDLGDRLGHHTMLPNDALEIDASDPLGGPDRYAYIAAVSSPKRSAKDYVDFDPGSDSIESEHYRLSVSAGRPVGFALQTHKHEKTSSIIDGFEIRVHAKLLTFFNYRLTAHDMHTRLLAWKDGPVRAIFKDSHSIDLMLGIKSPEVTSEVLFYRDSIENPFKVKLPWVPSAIFGNLRVRAYLNVVGSGGLRVGWSGRRSPAVTAIPDATPERARAVDSSAPVVSWVSLVSGDRMMLQTVVPTGDMKLIQQRLYYRDAPGSDGDRPRLQSISVQPHNFDLGYTMTGWGKLSSGTHYFDSVFITAPLPYTPSLALKEMDTALEVRVRPEDDSR